MPAADSKHTNGPRGWFGSAPAPPLAGLERIAVLRANRIGDFVLALPALESLKAAYPEAETTLLGLEWHRDFLAGRPGPVDATLVVPPVSGVSVAEGEASFPGEEEAFLAEMRSRRFDLAVQMHGGGRHSNRFVASLGARLTAGASTEDAPSLDISLAYEVQQHETLRCLELVSRLGAPPVTLRGRVPVLDRDRAEARALVGEARRPLVAIHPGAHDVRRRWPVTAFAAVAEVLAARGCRLVVTGSAQEAELAAELAAASRAQLEVVAGRLSLGGLAALFSTCALVLGNDTGPLHLARAVGTPTVTIYWCWNAVNAAPLGREQDRTLVSWRVHCPVCGADAVSSACSHQASLVADVGEDEVAVACLDLLGAGS